VAQLAVDAQNEIGAVLGQGAEGFRALLHRRLILTVAGQASAQPLVLGAQHRFSRLAVADLLAKILLLNRRILARIARQFEHLFHPTFSFGRIRRRIF
jgi:hypothetical protein